MYRRCIADWIDRLRCLDITWLCDAINRGYVMLVKLCTLIAMASPGAKHITVDGLRFKPSNATEVYRCELVNRNDLHALLRERGINRYRLINKERL